MDRIAIMMLILGNLVSMVGEFVAWRSKGERGVGCYTCKVIAGVLIVIAALLYFGY